ncbi:hypothetical protein NC651_014861 [Populus alba x Populus x berolinensis]|nr:hypothetical protein NC651_014861 [Populus alba x Populus x berolinensis]
MVGTVDSELEPGRYDSRTTIFSPEGRLYEVEYAMEAIRNAGSAIGILSKDGVVLVGEKKVTSKLLQTSTSTEKMYKIDDHDYKDEITREEAVQLALKVLSKTKDSTSLTSEKLELAEPALRQQRTAGDREG